MATVLATPGVYIEEKSAFPNSAVPVATAVPAFIGYTEKATRDKKDLTNLPTRISSFGEYLLFFGGGPKTRYDVADDEKSIYKLSTKTDSRFMLFYSMKLFFANGGSDCYIVSIGNYKSKAALSDFDDEKVEDGEIKLKGIRTLLKEQEPTMVVIPDAVLLGEDDCAALQQLMLMHCQKMASRVSVLDVWMNENDDKKPDTRDIVARFRDRIGTNNLMWGAAYYPWVRTNITGAESVNFNNVDSGSWDAMIGLLTAEVEREVNEGLDKKRGDSIISEIKAIKTTKVDAANALVANATKANAAATKAVEDADAAIAAANAITDAAKKEAALKTANADKATAETKAAVAAAALTAAQAVATAVSGTITDTTPFPDQETVDAAVKTAVKTLLDSAEAAVVAAVTAKKTADAGTDDTAKATAAADLKKKEGIANVTKSAGDAFNEAVKATVNTLHQTLLAVSPLYKSIMTTLREKLNLLPPSAGLAGIYSMVDNNVGVFQSPANVSIGSVIQPVINLTNDEQEDLNVPLNGKAVNAIRTFPGKGVLIWGARTLDGNSQDWRYISVRRTVIFIEQSVKFATEPYVFAPNTATTWTNVKAMITNFLTNVWQSGALAGTTPADAFSVDVGLGATMTPIDILDGIMRVTVKIAVTRPAEFIVITFQQKMQQS